jgi:hypothetical protein
MRVRERGISLIKKDTTEAERNGIGLLDKDVFLYQSSDFTNESKDKKNRHVNIKRNTRVFEHEQDALAQLATCRKVTFVGSTEEIQDFNQFNQERIKLGHGKVKFLLHSFYIIIQDSAGGFLRRRMAGLLSPGIWHIWPMCFTPRPETSLRLVSRKQLKSSREWIRILGLCFRFKFSQQFLLLQFV